VCLGVEEREPPVGSSSGGADGERIAARECGEGIVAVRVLLRPETEGKVCLMWDCSASAERCRSHKETGELGCCRFGEQAAVRSTVRARCLWYVSVYRDRIQCGLPCEVSLALLYQFAAQAR